MLIQLIIVRFLFWNLLHATHVPLPVSFWSPHFLLLFLYLLFSLCSFPPLFPPSTPLFTTHLSSAPYSFLLSKHFPILTPIHFCHHHYLLSFLFFSFPAPPPNTCRTIRRSTWSTYTAGLTACAPRMKAPTSSSPPLPSI